MQCKENLREKTVKELKEKAKELNIKGYSKLKKEELIDAITDSIRIEPGLDSEPKVLPGEPSYYVCQIESALVKVFKRLNLKKAEEARNMLTQELSNPIEEPKQIDIDEALLNLPICNVNFEKEKLSKFEFASLSTLLDGTIIVFNKGKIARVEEDEYLYVNTAYEAARLPTQSLLSLVEGEAYYIETSDYDTTGMRKELELIVRNDDKTYLGKYKLPKDYAKLNGKKVVDAEYSFKEESDDEISDEGEPEDMTTDEFDTESG